MSKEITSIKTGKTQIVSEYVWENIKSRKWERKYTVKDLPEKKLKEVPIIEPEAKILIKPPEIKTKTKKKNG